MFAYSSPFSRYQRPEEFYRVERYSSPSSMRNIQIRTFSIFCNIVMLIMLRTVILSSLFDQIKLVEEIRVEFHRGLGIYLVEGWSTILECYFSVSSL